MDKGALPFFKPLCYLQRSSTTKSDAVLELSPHFTFSNITSHSLQQVTLINLPQKCKFPSNFMDPKALKIASTLPQRIALQLQSRDRLDKMIHRVRNSLGCQALLAFSVPSSFRTPLHSKGILIRSFTLIVSELFSLVLENSGI